MGEEDRQAHYMGFHRSSPANVRPERKRRAREIVKMARSAT
jgi:hypothetical protein